jgi:shikimate kinase
VAVALVGFMGAGKSAVGRELATALALPFVDTDDLIVAQAGPVDVIFRERGETGFRTLETRIVTDAVAAALEQPCVLALGGGAVLSADVREALARLPHVVWLTAPADVLWARTSAARQAVRPLAADEATFGQLLGAREALYRRVATLVADAAAGTPAEVAAGISAAVRAESAARSRAEGGGL